LVFSPMFINAISWRLAAEIAMPLTRDEKRMDMAFQMFNRAISEAKTFNSNESYSDINREAEWITGRS